MGLNFLQNSAAQILGENGGRLDEITVIIPNKRAAVYLQDYLARATGKSFFAPEVITINEWVSDLTRSTILNQYELLFVLYEVHTKLQNKQDDFNEFLKWGKTLLTDFDEIDRYLISPDSIFRDLRNIKEIENWSFNDPELSGGQERFLFFWNQLPDYYSEFNSLLASRGACYSGQAYKQLAQNIAELLLPSKHYYFLGFNALSLSEEKIIHYLIREKKATFHTEMDQFYMLRDGHEAGYFYRQICERWGIRPKLTDCFSEFPKKFEFVETAQQTGQAKIAGKILADLQRAQADMNKTAVVLADESLLIPLLHEIPEEILAVNVTMGYPLKYSHLKSLIDLVFDLQFNFQKFKNSSLYHKSLLRVLDHNYLFDLVNDPKNLIALEEHVVENNHVFIDWEKVTQYLPELKPLQPVFTYWSVPAEQGFYAITKLIDILYELFKNSSDRRKMELEILYHFSVSVKKFQKIWQNYQPEFDLKSFKRMFYQFWQNESLAYLGNPIEGVQIMGILETRLLDFDNLIILGMNEGNLPQVNKSNSFIPFDLKRHHQLPVEEERQAIFAHHFYRLLHRAKNIFITYNSGDDDMGKSEKSRYLSQLENELDTNSGHSIKHSIYSPDDRNSVGGQTVYHSDEGVHQKLDVFFGQKGLSPSALNKLIACPLDFYYRYILEMREGEQVEENIESSTFGTKIHDVLEDIFKRNFLDPKKPLDATTLKREVPNLEKYLLEKYLETFDPGEIKYGQNKLSFDISLDFLNHFIQNQIEEISRSKHPIFILDLEKNLDLSFELDVNGKQKKIRISGLADRVDQVGDEIRIIDYKSGKCDADKVTIPKEFKKSNDLEDFMNHKDKGYARQLLMYALMYRSKNPDHQHFSAGIISMINIREWLQNVRISGDDTSLLTDELLTNFESELKARIAELYHPDFVFRHNPDALYCEHCNT